MLSTLLLPLSVARRTAFLTLPINLTGKDNQLIQSHPVTPPHYEEIMTLWHNDIYDMMKLWQQTSTPSPYHDTVTPWQPLWTWTECRGCWSWGWLWRRRQCWTSVPGPRRWYTAGERYQWGATAISLLYTGRAALYSPPGGQQEHLPPVTSLHVQEKCREQTWHYHRVIGTL